MSFHGCNETKKSFPPYQLGEKTKFLVLLIALANTMGKMLFLSLGKKDEISSVADFARKHHGKNALSNYQLGKKDEISSVAIRARKHHVEKRSFSVLFLPFHPNNEKNLEISVFLINLHLLSLSETNFGFSV